MDQKVRLLHAESNVLVSRQTAPEFYRLYQQAVLLSLEEQGVLNRRQLENCLERLGRKVTDMGAEKS